jgi:GrpB-like predicted nucleotidyltransferase (UPF0157 family)
MTQREISDAATADIAKRRSDAVELVSYDPIWVDEFQKIASFVQSVCGKYIVAIHHIGSTSVPGLAAKPLIDLLPVLRTAADGERCADLLEPRGFFYHGDYGIPGRHFFRQREPSAINMHMFAEGSIEIERHVVFRDALREDDALRAAYETLKRGLAAQFPNDVDSYAKSKSDFIEKVLRDLGAPERPSGPDR